MASAVELPSVAEFFDIRTHNGFVTVHNPATGDHRTFQINTQPKDAKFAAGMRVASLLVGPDNESDYRGFGFVIDGRVVLWKANRESKVYQWYKRFLEAPRRHPKLEINFDGRCRACNRLLTTPHSVRSGIGPICAGREEGE